MRFAQLKSASPRRLSRIIRNADKNVRQLVEQMQEKRASPEGVDAAEVEKALEAYVVERRE